VASTFAAINILTAETRTVTRCCNILATSAATVAATRSVHNFLSYLANTQTNKQTKSGKNITSLAEVIKSTGEGTPLCLTPVTSCTSFDLQLFHLTQVYILPYQSNNKLNS